MFSSRKKKKSRQEEEEAKMPHWLREEKNESQPLLDSPPHSSDSASEPPTIGTLRQRQYFVLPSRARRRHGTNRVFFYLFLIYWIGMLALGAYSFKGFASWGYITTGMDYTGQPCTHPSATSSLVVNTSMNSRHAYTYYPDIHHHPAFAICVNACPATGGQNFSIQLNPTTEIEFTTYATRVDASHVCAPQDAESWHRQVDPVGRLVGALSLSWLSLVASFGTAVVVSFLYLLSVRYFGGSVLFLSMLLIQIGLVIGAYEIWIESSSRSSNTEDGLLVAWLKAASGICFVLAAVFFLSSVYFIRHLWLAWSFIQYATRSILRQILTFSRPTPWLIFPVVQSLLILLVSAYGIIVWVCIVSTGHLKTVSESFSGISVDIQTFEWTQGGLVRIGTSGLLLFGLYWAIEFILVTGSMIHSVVAILYYFEPDVFNSNASIAVFQLAKSIVCTNHLGSCAVAAMCASFRPPLHWMAQRCCGWLKHTSSLTQEAIAVTGVHGTDFFLSSRLVASLSQANLLRVGALDRIGSSSVVLGKLLVSLLSIWVGWIVAPPVAVACPILPILATGVLSYAIAHAFLSIYQVSINTLLLCFLIDEDMHGGQTQAAFAPYPLTKLIDEHLRPKWQTVL